MFHEAAPLALLPVWDSQSYPNSNLKQKTHHARQYNSSIHFKEVENLIPKNLLFKSFSLFALQQPSCL